LARRYIYYVDFYPPDDVFPRDVCVYYGGWEPVYGRLIRTDCCPMFFFPTEKSELGVTGRRAAGSIGRTDGRTKEAQASRAPLVVPCVPLSRLALRCATAGDLVLHRPARRAPS